MAESNPGTAPAPAEPELVLTRVFPAPRALVFRAWTEPAQLMRWWAPKGWTTPFCTVELRVGGPFRFCMQSPEGREIWGRGIYREIVRPERIVYADEFTDAEGRPVPPSHYGMSAGHPAQSLVTVTFAEHEDGTQVILRHSVPETFPEREGMAQGWNEMFDRLAGALAQATGGAQ